MKNKRDLFIMIVVGIILILTGFILYLTINKYINKKVDDNKNSSDYVCSKETKQQLELIDEQISEIGNYTQIEEYSFSISDNKIISHQYKLIYKFDNRKGYDKVSFAVDNYTETLDDKNLTKTYTNKELMIGNLDNIDNYLNSIEELQFECKKK